MSKNLFAWASIGENGKATGGKPGDQTGREVKVGPYYNFGQNQCVRFKGLTRGRKAAKIAKQLAADNSIGYNQAERGTLYNLAMSCGWNQAKLLKALKTKKVNCDCSAFVATVINLAYGAAKVSCFTTATMVSQTADKYPKNFSVLPIHEAEAKWHKGDMPLKAGKHVIINV